MGPEDAAPGHLAALIDRLTHKSRDPDPADVEVLKTKLKASDAAVAAAHVQLWERLGADHAMVRGRVAWVCWLRDRNFLHGPG